MCWCAYVSIRYWQGDIKELVGDVCAMKPTLFCAVPRVLERVYTKIQDTLKSASFIKRALFNFGYNRKKYYLEKGVAPEKVKLVRNNTVNIRSRNDRSVSALLFLEGRGKA